MVESLLIRFLARLNAMGALTGSFILLIICNIAAPVFNEFNYSNTDFNDGGNLKLGIWGWTYTAANGTQFSPKTSVGYNFSPAGLPGYSANAGTANLNVVNKPLSESLIFVPLALGATGLALLLSLLPIRIVTLLAIGATFLAIGATGISFVLAIICFSQANARLGLLFNPNNAVHPMIGHCVWYLLACTTAESGAFIFLILALSPKKKRADTSARNYGDPLERTEKADGIDYGYRKSMTSERRSTRPIYNAYDEDYASNRGSLSRQGSRRSAGSGGGARSSRRSRDIDHRSVNDDEYERPRSSRRSAHGSSRRPKPPVSDEDADDDYQPGY